MMAKKPSALAGIFDDESETAPPAPSPIVPEAVQPAPPPAPAKAAKGAAKGARSGPGESAARRGSHPGKKAVLIHIPEDMHRTLRQLSVEEGGEPLTVITERLLRQYLVQRGHTRFAP
ncbi:MAG: hypothetical protein U9R07_16410 [Pseudomonadota bacterium]|nr:hypothetical protein [Pseudomonadota bacterium]